MVCEDVDSNVGPEVEVLRAGQEAAASCLSRIASHEAALPALMKAGTLERLVGLLDTCGTGIICPVLETIAGMVCAPDNREIIAKVRLLQSLNTALANVCLTTALASCHTKCILKSFQRV
eukprot:scaffold678559_cov42-Prasinocladus_malaysianus.AAC.1